MPLCFEIYLSPAPVESALWGGHTMSKGLVEVTSEGLLGMPSSSLSRFSFSPEATASVIHIDM